MRADDDYEDDDDDGRDAGPTRIEARKAVNPVGIALLVVAALG
jgi:hypothetical protein